MHTDDVFNIFLVKLCAYFDKKRLFLGVFVCNFGVLWSENCTNQSENDAKTDHFGQNPR